MTDLDRARRVRVALSEHSLDLLVCALPANVLMVSGYWPVVGTGLALAFANGPISLLIPEDEADLAGQGWADEVRTFRAGTLDRVSTAAEAIRKPLSAFSTGGSLHIGFEGAEFSEPASYAAMHLYAGTMPALLADCFPNSTIIAADPILAALRARKTSREIDRIRVACTIARGAFEEGKTSITSGTSEMEVANAFRRPLSTGQTSFPSVRRADGFFGCMSGSNSALAAGAYARSSTKAIDSGDLVLVHCNSYADGYWTDITRTFCVGRQDDRQAGIFDVVFRARQAAFEAIRPGVRAAAVDRAAREAMEEGGFGPAFKHSTGHGVGFGAISSDLQPRLHPRSPDVLEAGMVFNIEPAAYFENYGGMRHCDIVTVTDSGYELLTPFQCAAADLRLGG